MAAAELFLQILEEKDLVSAQVLQAARREIERTSPPPDAVGLSLWLVQGQHITASQAERLLAAVMQKSSEQPPSMARWQKSEPKPTEALRTSMPPPPAAARPKPPAAEPRSPGREKAPAASRPKPAAKAPADELDLAPMTEQEGDSAKKPAKAAPPVKEAATPAVEAKAAKSPGPKAAGPAKPATVGGSLEPLEQTMKGPLDSLIESESQESGGYDDPMAGQAIGAATTSKRFGFRRYFKNLFRRHKSKVVTVKAADPRQVKLVLFSWGVAFFAVIAAMAIFHYLSARDAVDIRRDASAAVEKGDYDLAIRYYDEFLKSYAKTSESGDVAMLRVEAKLRQAAKQASASDDWTSAFAVAEAQMKELPKSTKSDLLEPVGNALASIAAGMARQVKAKPDEASVGRLQAITNMIESNIPVGKRPLKMLEEDINPVLKQCGQAVGAQKELDQAVDEIGKAVAAGELPRAYAAYRNVVKAYAEVVDHPDLIAAMKKVSAVQQQAVKAGRPTLAWSHAERPADLIAAMPLAVRPVQGNLPAGQGKLRFVVDRGTAYALSAESGKVLWRRFVAHDPKLPGVTALPIVETSASDVVLCDPVHQELLRVRGLTGELLWRLSVGRPIVAPPVRAGKSLLLVQDRRLLFIDLAGGEASHDLSLPQSVTLPPVVDAAHGLIYLVAEQSNIYVLDGAKGECRQVLHLGHEAGTIAALPAVVGDFLLVAVNDSANDATLRAMSIAASPKDEPLRAVERINLKDYDVRGFITTAPAALESGAVIVTAQGGLVILERNGADDKAPFRVAAHNEPASEERAVHFLASDGRSFWVTGRQLAQYMAPNGKDEIVPQATTENGSLFVAPPTVEGGTMVTVVQRPGLPGTSVTAIDLAKNEPVWETWLAAPLTAAPTIGANSGKLTLMTASGGMFRLPPTALRLGAPPVEPIACVEPARVSKPFTSLIPLSEERFAISGGAETKSIAVYDPQAEEKRFRWLVSPQELAAGPAAFAGGVLAACANGQVFLLDPLARGEMAKPYEIKLPGVTDWKWQVPQAVNDKLAVLCDGDRRVMTINLTGGAYPMLAEGTAALSKTTLASPIAVLGKSVYVVDANDSLLSFTLPELAPGKAQPLGGHYAWGPQRVGKMVLAATENNRLIAVDEQQQVAWQVNMSYGPLAGTPFSAGDDIYLSAQSGIIWRISAADGKERNKVDAGCPLGTGPLPLGTHVIVGGSDGSLLEVKKP
jgi:outer membrane protein assembly factor BamB